jgi:transposase
VDSQGSLLTPELLLGEVVSKGSFYDRLAKVGPDLIKDEDFAHLYARGKGRPSIPPSVLMKALLLATKDGTSDRESARRTRADLDWKHALGLEVDHAGIGATTFSLFRARVVLHDADQQLFRATLRRAVDLGLFPRKILALIDSSPVLGAGAVQDTYALVVSAIGKLVGQAGPETLSKALQRSLKRYLREGKPPIDWQNRDARAAELARMVTAAAKLRRAVADRVAQDPDSGLAKADALLAAIIAQDVENDPDSGAPRLRQQVAKDRIVSTTDPDMRHGRKSKSRRFNGHKMHVVSDADTELVLGLQVGAGNGSDGDAAADLVSEVRTDVGLPVTEVVGDMAYGDGDTRAEVEAAGATMTAKVPPVPNSGGKFSKTDFDIDLTDPDRPRATCPAGHSTSETVAAGKDSKNRPVRALTFPTEICAACPLRERCTTSPQGRRVGLHHHEARLQDARAKQVRRGTITKFRQRPKVERKIDHLQDLGMRKARYRGHRKTKMQLLLAGVVANINRTEVLLAARVAY